jgi:isopenicillin N synthase-like dioxygenase
MSIFDEVTKRLAVGILRAVATSLIIEPDDFDCAQFSQRGSFA